MEKKSKTKEEEFSPAKGVTLANSISYIAAIEEAAMNDFRSIEPELRQASLIAVRTALCFCLETVERLLELHDLEGRVAADIKKPIN
jgi:hypothetical protein